MCVLIREVSSFQGANITYLYEVGIWSSVLIREVSLIKGCPVRGVPLYTIFLAKINTCISRTIPCSDLWHVCNHIKQLFVTEPAGPNGPTRPLMKLAVISMD